MLDFLKVAERHELPVISDEIYGDLVFTGHIFHSLASLTTSVPILACGGLAKKYLVPGWRVGWVIIHDNNDKFTHVRKGLVNLSQLILGSNSLIQAAIPEILNAPDEFHKKTIDILENNANLSRALLADIPGITPIFPQGAMYLMVCLLYNKKLQIDLNVFKFTDDMEFVETLAKEESVLCLPGKCFRCPKPFVRVVFSSPGNGKDLIIFRRKVENCIY